MQGKLMVQDPQGKVLFECFTIELPWKENKTSISCIPTGTYKLALRTSQKYAQHIHILQVPNRSFILIHPGNYVHELRGCIAVGDKRIDINADGIPDIANSKKTMKTLLSFVTNQSTLTIV
jgi:hypothetical protein